MLSERSRNTIVGLTILAALALALFGIGLLGHFPRFFKPKPYEVRVDASNAGGVLPGAKVNFNGVPIGTVKAVRLVANPAATNAPAPVPASRTGLMDALTATPATLPSIYAEVILAIDAQHDIPVGTTAAVGSQGFNFSGASVSLIAPQLATTAMLPKDGTAHVQAGPADSGLLPKEVFADIHTLKEDLSVLSRELTTVARDMHTMLAYTPLERLEKFPPGHPDRPAENISTLILKLNKTVDHVNGVLQDPKFPEHVRTIVANLADASGQLKEVLATIKTTVSNADGAMAKVGSAADNIGTAAKSATATLDIAQGRLVQISEKLVGSLRTLDATMEAITNGNGTAGKLVKDAKLYDGLVDLTRSLQTTTEELNKLVHQWKNDGVPLKVGIGK